MRKLLIDIADLGGRAMPDDKVTLWAPFHRESLSNPNRVVSTARVDVILDEEGKAEIMVEPGPLRVQFKCRGFSDTEVKRAVVPEDGDEDVLLKDILSDSYGYEPEVVSAVRQAAEMARLAANRVGTAEQVGVWADQASTAAGATSDDRRQTGEDRGVVEATAIEVADNRRQTGEDRVATGEDRAHIDGQVSLVTDYVDQNVDHVDSQVSRVDNQVVHVDGQVTHVDSQVEHVDVVRSHVDSQSTFVDSVRTVVEGAAEDTADDRRQTGEDRSAVESAAVQVADDRRQTGEDRVATGADRTHIDGQFDLVTDYVDQNVIHIDSQVSHIDSQVVHVDGQVTHVDSAKSHVDSQSTFVDSARTIVEEAVARVGTAEQVEFWYDGAVEAAGLAETTASNVQAIVDNAADVIRAEIGDNVDRAESAAVKAEQHEAGAAAAAAVEVEKLKGDAPEAFDTLGEIAGELARNETERAALTNSIAEKAKQSDVTDALAGKSDVGHGHVVDDVDGLDVALAGKSDVGHGHVVGDIDGLGVALGSAGKSAEWGSVSGKPSAFPPEGHRHTTGQIDNLDTLIDQRARALVTEASSAHFWDGQGTWQAPWWAGPNDRVFNLDTGEIHSVQEVN